MEIRGLDRVVIATHDLPTVASQFTDLLGLEFSGLLEPTTETDSGEQRLEMTISGVGVELIAPVDEDNEVARFLAENGPGLYALSLRVADLDAATAELAEKGVDPVGEFEAGGFAEAFFHPAAFGGAFVILAEYDAPHDAATAMRESS